MTSKERVLAKLNQRYTDERRGGKPEMTEEEIFWEQKQKQAKTVFGSRDKKSDVAEKQYELLLDNQVDFVQADLMEGILTEKRKKAEKKLKKMGSDSDSDDSMSEQKLVEMEQKLTPQERERLEIQQQRESSPMYNYRDELLAAIRDNQVLIIVAETGSGKTTQVP